MNQWGCDLDLRLFNFLYMSFTNNQSQSEQTELNKQLAELDQQFRECALKSDWMGCLSAIKKQNRLLGLCPIESESDADDSVIVGNG
jgi:hypothetical protein